MWIAASQHAAPRNDGFGECRVTLIVIVNGYSPSSSSRRRSLWRSTGKPQARPKPKAALSRPESFRLDTEACRILQSTVPKYAKKKEALLENATRGIEPHEITELMAPFASVHSLVINSSTLGELPLLPCPDKLESLLLTHSDVQAIRNITNYTNLHTLQIVDTSLSVTEQHQNQTGRLAVLTQLHNLRTLNCWTLFTLAYSAPEDRAFLIRLLESNPAIEDFTCAGGVATDVVQALGNLPLRRLLLQNSEIDNDKFALLPFGTLEELRLHGWHNLTNLEPLQDSTLRVLHLNAQENLGDTQVICSMPHLEELDLTDCHLTDAQAEPLLQLSQKLRHLMLDSHKLRLSDEMCQRLKTAFGNKVSVKDMTY
ncbi:MAG: hypothetical protein ACPGUZ_03930 [Holosporaceae bacterium]